MQSILDAIARFFGRPVTVTRQAGDSSILVIGGLPAATAMSQLLQHVDRFDELLRTAVPTQLLTGFWLEFTAQQRLCLSPLPSTAGLSPIPTVDRMSTHLPMNYPVWNTRGSSNQPGIVIPANLSAPLWPATIEKA